MAIGPNKTTPPTPQQQQKKEKKRVKKYISCVTMMLDGLQNPLEVENGL